MLKKIAIILRNSSMAYTIMAIIASGINFGTLIIFGRIFTVDEYGVIITFQALLANIAILMTPLQIMICKTIVEGGDNQENTMMNIICVFMIINITIIILMVCIGGFLISYLHFTRFIEYALYMLLVLVNNVYIAITGVVQGKQSFYLLGWIGIIMYLFKLVAGVLLCMFGVGALAIIVSFLLAEIICSGIIVYSIRKNILMTLNKLHFSLNIRFLKWYGMSLLLYIIVSLYMNNGDLLLGNLYCSQTEIGLYAVAINLAKISVFLIATPIGTLILPKVAAYKENSQEQLRILFFAETVTLTISLLYGVCFRICGKFIIHLLYGEAYVGAEAFISQSVIFSIILGVFWVFYQYAFATEVVKTFTFVTFTIGVALFGMMYICRIGIDVIPIIMSIGMILSIGISLCINKCMPNSLKE